MPVPVAPGRWPLIGHTPAMLRRRFGFTSSLYAHGDVVRVYLGPMETYFVTSPELTHQVLVTDGSNFRKGAMFEKFRPFVGNGIGLSDGVFHLRQRRLMQPAFHHATIAGYAEIMARAAVELVRPWRPGEVREVDHDMQAVAVAAVGESLFSTELGKAAIEEARRSIPVILKYGMIRVLSPAFVEKLPIPANRRFDAAVDRMRTIVEELIDNWRAEQADRSDLLSMLLLARDADTGERMTGEQVRDEVITLLTAGIETSALALSWLFHEIARHPEVEQKLHDEIDEVLGGRQATAEDVPRLVYTRQVVNEVLRMYPLWILMRRVATEVDLGGVRLPPGTEVIISPHAMHFDPRFHDHPGRFDPDRWAGKRAKDLPRGAYIPFGAGAHQCIGNSFAMTEIAIVVATIAAKWRLVPVPGKPVREKYTTTAYPSRLPMTVVPRFR
ncbi:cytochrome P450 [Amycolatopsis oliviviridis]|uniref:cytochrome P450 n=1 Tax=Amycolatopsis oliviviridis TaxID=1471590 RepID=UPI00174A6ACE|nr:cytochrome P450 [Amycolatopsis oliviviridis]